MKKDVTIELIGRANLRDHLKTKFDHDEAIDELVNHLKRSEIETLVKEIVERQVNH